MNTSEHAYWMDKALQQAMLARDRDEIPVGAVLVKDGILILAEHNRTRENDNPLAHAEKLIVDKILSRKIKYLYEYSLYVTLEPCLMCAGSLIWSRLGTLVFGASDPKAGAVGSIYNVLTDKSFNHHPVVVRGVMESQCSSLLSEFFKKKRQ
ncbi:MAG: tRNA adenosine(34) deaminase TadA [Candidatus Cloacimonadaceae bacterium]|nr:tRNA adenosine(34) deaminase TadA [Candidatus Cloacimonadaceae bacterium]